MTDRPKARPCGRIVAGSAAHWTAIDVRTASIWTLAIAWQVAAVMFVVNVVADILTSAPASLDVADFGAQPDDGRDDGDAIRNALGDAAGRRGPVTVRFHPGVYDVITASSTGPYLTLQEARDVTIDGAGAELRFARPDRDGLAVQRSAGVTVRGVTIDYRIPPFAQGVVEAVDALNGTIDVRVADGFPSLDAPWFDDATWGTRHDPQGGRLRPDGPDLYSIGTLNEPVGERTWRVLLHAGVADFAVGDGFVVPIRGLGSAVVVVDSTATTLADVTVHAAPGSAFTSLASTGLVVERSTVAVRAGSGRWISTSGDGLHHSGGGDGPVVHGNAFSRMLDDGVNVYSAPGVVESVAAHGDGVALVVQRPFPIDDGDRVELFDPARGTIRSTATVLAADRLDTDHWSVVIAADVEGGRVVGTAVGDQLLLVDDIGAGFSITRNRFADHRARGVVVRGYDGTIEANTFVRLPTGIVVGNEPDWPEGNIPSDIRILGNRFEDVAPGAGSTAIVVFGARVGPAPADRPLVEDIVVADNHIDGAAVAVSIAAAHGVQVTDTMVDAVGIPTSPVVVSENSSDVAVRRLVVTSDQVGRPCRRSMLVQGVDEAVSVTLDGQVCAAG